MYEVVKTNIADRGKLVKPYWIKGKFKTEELAKQAIENLNDLSECLYDYKIVKVS